MHRHRKLMTLRVQFYNGLCVCRIWYLHTYYEYVVRNIVLVVHSRRKNQFLLSWLRKEGSMCLESVVVNVYWHLLATWLTQCMTAAAAAGPATVACYLSTHVGNNKKKCVATLAQPCEIVLPSIFRVSALHAGSILCISSSVKKGTALSMKKGVWPLDWPFWHLWPWQTDRQTVTDFSPLFIIISQLQAPLRGETTMINYSRLPLSGPISPLQNMYHCLKSTSHKVFSPTRSHIAMHPYEESMVQKQRILYSENWNQMRRICRLGSNFIAPCRFLSFVNLYGQHLFVLSAVPPDIILVLLHPDRPLRNFRASTSGDRWILCTWWTSCHGFWSPKVVKGSAGMLYRGGGGGGGGI